MKAILPSLLTGSLLLSAAMAGETGPSTGAVAKDVPLGHSDFYPSTEHPVGYRGDGTGVFPGAKGVALEWDHRTGKNIIWKCRLPYWGNSPPIVVGKRAFVASEPDELICVDTETGAIQWKRSIVIDQFIPEADRAGVRKALRDGNDETMMLDLPGPEAVERWLKAIEPTTDEAMAETARRIAEIRKSHKDQGLLIEPGEHASKKYQGVDTGFPTPEGVALLEKHKILDFGREKAKFAPFPRGSWTYHLGFSMPSPCSDGKHVWYQTSLGAIACLDLDGKVVWIKRMLPVGPTTWKGYSGGGSPVLIKNTLYYHDHRAKAGGQGEYGYGIVAVEKDTGKEIWRRPRDKSDIDHHTANDGFFGSSGRGASGMTTCRLGDRDFIVTAGRYILDAATGQTVGNIPELSGQFMRRPHTVIGNSLFITPDKVMWHYRLSLMGDKVTAERVWTGQGAPWSAATVWQGWVYLTGGNDGNPIYGHPLDRPQADFENPKFLYKKYGFKAFEFPVAKKFFQKGGFQYSTPAVAEGHMFCGSDINGMEVYKLDGEKTAVVNRNFMDLLIRANPFFQGNRMYVRTFHYLYCIGVNDQKTP